MKTNKNITLDTEIVVKLKKVECASALIEQLLREHFENNKPNVEKIDQKRAELSNKRREIRNLKAEIKQIKEISMLETQLIQQKDKNKEFENAFLKWGATKAAINLKVPSKVQYFREKIYKEVN